MLRLRPLTWAIVFLGLFLTFRILATPIRGVDNGEAWHLWLTHDIAPMVGNVGDVFRAMRANVGDMVTLWRETPQPPLYIALLDVWRMLTGANMLMGRWLSSLIGMLAFAITLRGAYRLRLEGKWGDVIFVGLLFGYSSATIGAETLIALWSAIALWGYISYRQTHQRRYISLIVVSIFLIALSAPTWHINIVLALLTPPIVLITLKLTHLKADDTIHVAYNPLFATTAIFLVCSLIGYQFIAIWVRQDWTDIIQTYTVERTLTQPMVIAYSPQHPLAYYDHTEKIAFGRGVTVNIGWRDFSADELAIIAQALPPSDVIWIVAPNGERRTEALAQSLGAYNRVFLGNINGIMPQRLTIK
ncbi:MAG TPA: hypothetical protein PLZ51_02335 [Aggregatilineales bacterium]|nr:hypothetical protein [Aggregatilineales bacterium]